MSALIRVQTRKSIVSLGLLLLAGLLLSGCAWLPGGDDDELNIDLGIYLPKEWTPIGNWRDVNIDADDTLEHLLFFAYGSGQVGGVIYDPQADTSFAPRGERSADLCIAESGFGDHGAISFVAQFLARERPRLSCGSGR